MVRMLASAAKIRLGDLRVGKIDDQAWPRLINTAAAMSETGIFIDDTSGVSPLTFARRCGGNEGQTWFGYDHD